MDMMFEKLKILADSAKYDVSCSSSGVGRRNNGKIGNAFDAGICHSWAADGRCISLLKVLFTNKCVYDCEYCINRRSADTARASFEPEELARLTIEFYRRNYIEGLFLSSAVEVSPDHTAERILQALKLLRKKYGFAGYIHAKLIPGASEELVHAIGLEADRVSVNIEMPTSDSLALLAPQKKPKEIFAPMRQITNGLIERKGLKGPGTMFKGQDLNTDLNYLDPIGREIQHGTVPHDKMAIGREMRNGGGQLSKTSTECKVESVARQDKTPIGGRIKSGARQPGKIPIDRKIESTAQQNKLLLAEDPEKYEATLMSTDEQTSKKAKLPAKPKPRKESFAPAGQTTQMIIGATADSDYKIIKTSENLYRTFKMKRVYYSAYIPVVQSLVLPDALTPPPLAREHRIYQADWLLRFYGFSADEILNEKNPNLDVEVDPKVSWALRNLQMFPIEVNKASMDQLLRIPGVGTLSALRILRQRKVAAVKYDDLKKMGVVLKRAKHFLTCSGKYYGEKRFEPQIIKNDLLGLDNGRQISMFELGEQQKLESRQQNFESRQQKLAGHVQNLERPQRSERQAMLRD